MTRRARPLLRPLLMLLALIVAPAALAQACNIEAEPNDTPPQATPLVITGEGGPFTTPNATLDAFCISGELGGSSDQDFFWWDVTETASLHSWSANVEGLPAQLTKFSIFVVTLSEDGTGVTSADELFSVEADGASRAASAPFLVRPGRYMLGVTASGGSGEYAMTLEPQSLAYRANQLRDNVLTGELRVYGEVQGEVTQGFIVNEAGFAWGLELETSVGSDLTLVLEGPGGRIGTVDADAQRPGRLNGYALEPGDYTARVEGDGIFRLTLTRQGRVSDGQELEPNDDWTTATRFPVGTEMRGSGESVDFYRLEVDAESSSTPWDLSVDAAAELTVQLLDADGNQMLERREVGVTIEGLFLGEGDYRLVIRGRDDTDYRLAWSRSTAETFDEREPNDLIAIATDLGANAEARGVLSTQDRDVFRFEVEGDAQLYRLQVIGEGVTHLTVFSGGGVELASAQGERRLRVDDLLLFPGAQYVEIRGDGQYAFRALPLGPAPAQEPPAEMPEAEEELAAAPAGESDDSRDPASVDPTDVGLLTDATPPPPGLQEMEPNDDASRAHRLMPGAVHVGRLSSPGDIDTYRFHLAGDQYVRIELVSPAGDVSIPIDLESAGRFYALPGEEGQPVVAERWLLAGDHTVMVRGPSVRGEVPTGYYQLRMTPLGPLTAPVDFEPNDDEANARRMPSELAWQGRVGEASDEDMYAFPVTDSETAVAIRFEASDGVRIQFRTQGSNASLQPDEAGTYHVTLPAGEPSFLRVVGSGRYAIELGFTRPPDADQLLPPRGDALSVELETPVSELAAFWHEGQQVETTATITNRSDEPQEVRLHAASTDPRTQLSVADEAVQLQPGESASVPVTLTVPADTRDDLPLSIQVAATGTTGSALSSATFALRCEAPPFGGVPFQPLPSTLLGRPNVLWSGFGATIHGDSAYANRDALTIDGRTAISNSGYAGPEHSPTFELAGGKPVTLVGTALNPHSNVGTLDQLRRFRIETSLDGANFTPVYEGRLEAARYEQSFLFAEPVTARYARLVALDDHAGRPRGYLGEWKLFAQDPALFSGANVADPAYGGHVVWSEPNLAGPRGSAVLTEDERVSTIDLRDVAGLTFVVGFQHGRAALVDAIEWHEPEPADQRNGRFQRVTLEGSLTGAAGPWEPLAEWVLERDAQGVARLELEEPQWARYVRVVAHREGEQRSFWPPTKLAIYEAAVGTRIEGAGERGYLSILGEWGDVTRAAAYEALVEVDVVAAAETNDDNDTRERATPLASGTAISGSVAVGEDVDWYRITIPQGQNHVEVHLGGDPSISYAYELQTADGRPAAAEERYEGDDVILSLFAEPGDYYLRLEEPKRSVVFSFDSSGSVAPYFPITYNSLASFARDVDGDREAVQLLPFNEPTPYWMLNHFSSEPLRVQRAIQEYDRRHSSSNAEVSMLGATLALGEREGTRAILLMTDAESGGYDLTTELWRQLERVRPRVFTFEISSAGNAYAQDMMQDWAAVNAGVYDMADGVGDFDAGFSRASCILRRPKRYEVEVTTAAVEPPGPGKLTVVPAPGAPQAAVEIVFDASGSMGRELPSGEQRITAAKRALEALVGEVLPESTPFALRAFGHITPSSCETRLDVPFGPLDRGKALSAVRAIEPKLLSGTPIAESLALVAQDLSASGGGRTIILITDGQESCGGDPAAAVRQLREAGPVALAIVSLALEPEALAAFEALAEEVGATFVDVGSYEALTAAIEEALNPAFEVYDAEGALVAQGRVGGEAVELPMGVYEVRVLGASVEVFEGVRVPGDGEVTVAAGAR